MSRWHSLHCHAHHHRFDYVLIFLLIQIFPNYSIAPVALAILWRSLLPSFSSISSLAGFLGIQILWCSLYFYPLPPAVLLPRPFCNSPLLSLCWCLFLGLLYLQSPSTVLRFHVALTLFSASLSVFFYNLYANEIRLGFAIWRGPMLQWPSPST